MSQLLYSLKIRRRAQAPIRQHKSFGMVMALLLPLWGCAETATFCNRDNCSGCCSDGICLESNDEHCGLAGARCDSCQTPNVCVAGKCTDTTPGPCKESCGSGCCLNGACQAGTAHNACGIGALDCTDCTKVAQICDAKTRQCMPPSGSCGPHNCTGCCFGTFCNTGASVQQCGLGGVVCQSCTGDQICHKGACVARSSVDLGTPDAGPDTIAPDVKYNIVVQKATVLTPASACDGSCNLWVEVVISKSASDQLVGGTAVKTGNSVTFGQTVLTNIPRNYFDLYTNTFTLKDEAGSSYRTICTDFLSVDDAVLNSGTWVHSCSGGSATIEFGFTRVP